MESMRPKTQAQNGIIYLYAPKKSAKQIKKGGDIFWNIFFAVMCLAVLGILFFH